MFKLLLFSGLFVLSLCLPKDLSSQSDNMEFYSDLESSQFLLTDKNSRTRSNTQPPHHTSEMRNRVPRAVEELLSDEGSGMLEETTTVSPATAQAAATETTTTMATTTTTQSPVTTSTTTTTTVAATEGSITTTTVAPTTTTTTTTIATTTTATSSTPRFIVGIRMLLLNAFISDYNNPQSSAYQQQAASIVSWCTPIYSQRYGSMFVRVVVISLRSSIRYRQANTEAEIQVEFDQNAPENAPTSSDVALAIQQEASSTSNPIDVDINNIEVTRAPQVMSNAQFTTSENFVLSLLSINSTSYRNRAALIKEELEPFFHEDYSPDFICLTPETFSVGTVQSNSILHQSELHFTYNATLPSATDVYNTMLRAARSGKLSINIISVDGKDVSASSSGDVSSKINLFTTCSLTLLSLLLIRPW
ncbi:uncharacterized protein LOC134439721 isoform X1 [Engraulis encrasicolus]|uniref:uncharacterized protein LOC134439721 isoform X1 n=1 Tax=Engraulis encrasicolus TaxID=184585 RepID=UPI002FD0E2E3